MSPETHLLLSATALAAIGLWLSERALAVLDLSRGAERVRRAPSTAGYLVFALHVVLAFALVHDWSHARAREATARETAEVLGVEHGSGIWWNYVFLAAWTLDTAAWRLAPRFRARRRWLRAAWHAFFAFLAFFSTAVFGSSPVRVAAWSVIASTPLLLVARARLRARTKAAA